MRNTHLSFGGRDLADLLYVTKVDRSVVPGRDVKATTVAGADGALLESAALKPLEITVTAHVRALSEADVAAARRELASALWSARERELVLPDEEDKAYMAVYEGGAEPSRLEAWPQVEMTFYCADPVAYGMERTASVGSSATVDAGGTWPALPRVRCVPPSGTTSWTFRNVATGAFVTVHADFDGNAAVALDMGLERCTINGTDHAVDLGSDFFAVDGAQELSASAGTATVEWRERWL